LVTNKGFEFVPCCGECVQGIQSYDDYKHDCGSVHDLKNTTHFFIGTLSQAMDINEVLAIVLLLILLVTTIIPNEKLKNITNIGSAIRAMHMGKKFIF
tara:strand:- start:354 stop:647 length:294 start_codon:yes stop_codon:yes gene_type:complete